MSHTCVRLSLCLLSYLLTALSVSEKGALNSREWTTWHEETTREWRSMSSDQARWAPQRSQFETLSTVVPSSADKRIKACMSRFSSGAYTRMQLRHCARQKIAARCSNSDNDNVICLELVTVRSTSPTGILRGVFDGNMPGVRVGAVWTRMFL